VAEMFIGFHDCGFWREGFVFVSTQKTKKKI